MDNFSLDEIIDMAVQIEKNGYCFYDRALQRSDLDLKSRDLITMLRNDEITHERTFESLRDQIDNKAVFKSGDWNTIGSYLRIIADSHIFSAENSAINMAVNARDFKQIMFYAIAFEKDTLLYFYSLEKYVDDEKTKQTIAKIIDEEASHIMRLKNFLREI